MEPARAPMKNASRERRKAERVALAAQVQALERELMARRASTGATLEWRARASDEIRKRRLAECTNHQLREALARQESTLATLVRKLRGDAKAPVPSRCLHDAHGRRFALLLEEVDRACHEDLAHVFAPRAVLAAAGSGRGSAAFVPRLVRHPNASHGELVLEARRVSSVAWELSRCCEALWAASEQVARATHTDAWVSRPHGDVVMMRLRASADHGDDGAWHATSSLVEKRFWLADHTMAIVWRAVTSIDNREELADVYVEETGWTLVQDARSQREEEDHEEEDQEEDEDDDGTDLWDCVHTVPRSTAPETTGDDGASEDKTATVKLFTRHVMDATTAHLNAVRDRMENLLIDDCMREVS